MTGKKGKGGSKQIVVVAQPKKKKNGRPRGARGSKPRPGAYGGFSNAHRAVCAITDPFCPAARGARYPDGNASRTLGAQAISFVQVSTNDVGTAVFAFTPGAPYTHCWAAAAAGAVSGTFPNVYQEAGTGVASWFTSIATQFRVVSAGVEVMSLSNPMNAKGVVIAQESPDQAILGTAYDVTATGLAEAADCIVMPFANFKSFTWTARPGGPQSRQFQAFTPNTGDSSYDWTRLKLLISGAQASTAVLQLRIVVNYELVLLSGQAATNLARPAPPMNPSIIAATQIVQSAAGGLRSGAAAAVESRVKAAATDAFRRLGYWAAGKALTAAGGYFGGPLGAAAGASAGHMLIEDVD